MSSKKKMWRKLIMLMSAFVVCIFSAFYMLSDVMAWFSSNQTVVAGGMQVIAHGDIPVIIRRTDSNVDVGVAEVTDATVHIDNHIDDDEADTIQPGSSGYFTYVLEYDEEKHNDTHTFTTSVSVINNYYHDSNHGFFENKASQEKEYDQLQAINFINSHIYFFTDKIDGVYSGWIKSGEAFQDTLEETNSKYTLTQTLYWIWVMDYADIFNKASTVIDRNDLDDIVDYYTTEENRAKMFDEGTNTEDSFNIADYIIGTTLQYICFEIKVS